MKKGLLLVFGLLVSSIAFGQVKLSNGTNTANLDFSNAMPVSVGSNPSTAFSGAGYEPNTAAAGRLNSNAWAVTGWSNGALVFGGTQTTANTDYTRGAVAAAVTAGGMYAFTGPPHSAANPALMIQPGGSDWAPGTMTLRIENTGTTNITQIIVSYKLYNRNDQGRSNSFNFSYSADDVTYTAVPALDFTSPVALDALGWVLVDTKTTTITGLSVAPGAFYYIRWSGADVGGSGSRDEFGLDDISLEASFEPSCSLTDAALTDVHCENNNETFDDPTDDFIWFQLNPTGTDLGSGYNVTVSSGSVLLDGTDPALNVPYGAWNYFRLQQGSAGAGDVTLTITDADNPDCSIMVLLVDPGSCSDEPCFLEGDGLAGLTCVDNGTNSDPSDDYMQFDLNPFGSGLGASYSLSVNTGSVTLVGGAPAVNVAYGSANTFKLQNGSAGSGDVTVTITDDEDPACSLDVILIDPGSCSAASPCDIFWDGLDNQTCNDGQTPNNSNDDYISFSLTPFGFSVTTYSLTVSSGDVTLIGGAPAQNLAYSQTTFFRLQGGSAGAGNVTVFITDDADPDCVRSVTIQDPGSCSDEPCFLEGDGLAGLTCVDNGTNSDPSDDYMQFDLNPFGSGLGASYSLSVNTGSVTLVGGAPAVNVAYGSANTFKLQNGSAGSGDVTVTITDDEDPACSLDVILIDPGSCSAASPCDIFWDGLDNQTCNDGQTPNNSNDDYISFSLTPFGFSVTTYSLTVSSGDVTLIGGAPAQNLAYSQTTFFRLQGGSAGAGNVTVFITDDADPDCVRSVTIQDPGSCSIPVCDIAITDISTTDETCPGDNDGTVTITATCSTCQGLEYSLDGINWQPDPVFSGLAPGNDTVRVRDTADPSCEAQQSASIGAGDGVPPSFDQNPLPADATVDCDDPIPAAATLTATDAVDPDVQVTYEETTTPGTCPQESTITRTWTATDDCNNSVQHTQTITVVDNDRPILVGLPDSSLTVECDQPLPSLPTVTATDLCDPSVSVSYTTNTTPGTCPQESTITRTWTATDDCGNATSFTQTITVTDNTAPSFNQNPLPADITVSCSDIPMPEMLDGTDNCDPGTAPPVIFINEIHYDNTGADVNEFIEIAGTAGTDLSQYQIVLYNGANGAPYNTLILNGTIDNEGGSGFGAVSFGYPVNGLQNGAPDGLALATTSGMVVQFISYEGAFTAIGGVANGMLSTDIGVLEDGNNAVGTSLQLTGAGQEYGDFTWVGPIAASAGNLNAGQTITALPGVIPAMFSQMVEAGDCNGESIITRMWQVTDACGNSVTHTQIVTVEDTQGPAFSPPPLPMDITLSCEQPVPVAPTLTAADLCDVPGMLNERVWINEFHYDNTGGDVGEFIEVAGTAGTDLSTYNLVLYNGSNGQSYNTLVLGGVIPNQANGFGTVCFNYPVDGIQNGSPDAIALIHNVMGGMVVQFLSYEGAFMATNGPANGMMSTNIGVQEPGTTPVGFSLYLTGNGDEYADFTWTGPLAASNCGVNAGQTFIAASQGPVVTFEETQVPGNCPQERSIFRTWTATDNCGNETVLNQTITIVDNTPPTVNCPSNITLNLDIFGNASLSLGNINFSYSDNCAPNSSLVVLPFPTRFYDCDDEGTTTQVTISVQDPCGNVGSCTINVFVAPFSRCTPVILISDPCVCKNNATTLSNGQFGETIKIESLAGKTWTIIANTGLYSAASAAPPVAPTLIPVGTTFTQNPANSGDYYLTGLHVDAQGYSITVRNETGQILSIGNTCAYPNPAITADLSGPFCLYSEPVTLTGNPGDANIVSQGFTVNGAPATVFDPGQGVGQYEIVYTVNGGVPKAFGPNDPGCIQSVTVYVNVVETPSNLTCNDLVYLSLDDDDCIEDILPDMILEGSYGCFDDYIVEIDKTLPYGNGPWVPGVVDVNDIGKTYQVRVTHLVSGNKCWGNLKIEDKIAPEITCGNFSVPCNTPTLTPDYLFNTLGVLAALPTVTDCQNFSLSYIDSEVAQNCASGLTQIITRKWTAMDASGNSSTCEQTIGLLRPTLADVTLAPNYDGFAAPAFNCTSAYPTPDWIESQGLQGYPYVFGQSNGCNINWEFHDVKINVCDGSYILRRDWTIVDWCTGNKIFPSQVIKVEDKQGPAMVCPANLTVSVNPFQCCGNIDLPDLLIEDECSRINKLSGMVTTFDPFTGAQTGMYPLTGSLQDFPGNNWWDRDTMGVFGLSTCLPIGAQTVTYIAKDDCGNSSSCTFRLTIRDYVPPVAACDETTTVSIGVDDPFDCYGPSGPNGLPAGLDDCAFGGVTWVKATTFDDGSYDHCNNVKFTIRRMAPYSDCIQGLNNSRGTLPCDASAQSFPTEYDRAISEQDSIKFYCCEVGTTQTIILSVYQLDINGGIAVGPDGSLIKNECMIQVEVQDKLKPACIPPAQVTVNCENFDPSLWAYGKAQAADNCCLDTTKVYQDQCGLTHTANYALFDTVCNKGTITRTFRVFDCHGFSSQCTQRVIVTYEQDYFVKFPNDVIITVCDGSGVYGEPLFFGEDCELLGVSYEDQIFTVVPDACFKIERTWTIINWCTYDPNLPCIEVPNPNPNPISNAAANLPGPTVSACGTIAPWAPTVVKINPTDPQATNFCTFYNKNANCYKYKQVIKVLDNQPPTGTFVIPDCSNQNWTTPNNSQLLNEMFWWSSGIGSHDLCEEPTDLCITGTDACSGSNINIEYLLFLDLDGDGTMETVINSVNTGLAGLGWNNVLYNNLNTPNFSGGTPRTFDERPVPANQKYGFAIQETVVGNNKTACVRWNTQQQQNNFVVPELPHGTHKIKWFITDGCGNNTEYEYTFTVEDCKPPTVVCINGLSVNIMPNGMVTLWASDFLQYMEDNCTPPDQLKLGVRKCGTGLGFPVDGSGFPQTNVTFTCADLGTQCVEIWSVDQTGNADYCETYIIVQDNMGNCAPSDHINVAGALKTEMSEGIEEAMVQITGTSSFTPPYNYFDLSDNVGKYEVMNNLPLDATFEIAPEKDDNPLNGVTTYDLVLISKHILGTEPLDSPFKIIAADANKSNSVTTFDIVELRKLILGIYTALPNNKSWRFVDYAFNFPNPNNPFQTAFPETVSIADAMTHQMGKDFMGVKVGDVNYTAVANATMQAEDRTTGTALFDINDREVKVGEEFDVHFKAAQPLKGFQFTMTLQGLETVGVAETDRVNASNFGMIFGDQVTVSIDGAQEFSLRFRAKQPGKLSQMLGVSGAITRAEAYSENGRLGVAFRFGTPAGSTISGVGFELYQNQPNPFVSKTSIGFYLPEAGEATLSVFDEAGRMVYQQKGQFAKGENTVMLERALLNTTGLLYYQLETATHSATKKMIQAK